MTPAGTDDQAPSEEVAEDGDIRASRPGLASDSADALLPPDMQRNCVNQFSSGGTRTHDAYVVGRNQMSSSLPILRSHWTSCAEATHWGRRTPRFPAQSANCDSRGARVLRPRGGDAVHRTSSYSERVEGLGVWKEIALPPTSRTGGWMPENFAAPDPGASRIDSENVDEICRAVEAAEAAGRTEVAIDGEVVPLRRCAISSSSSWRPVKSSQRAVRATATLRRPRRQLKKLRSSGS